VPNSRDNTHFPTETEKIPFKLMAVVGKCRNVFWYYTTDF